MAPKRVFFYGMEKEEKLNIFKRILRRKKLLILIVVGLSVAGYFVRRTFFPSTDGFEEAKVERGVVREELVLSGEVKADEQARLSFLTSGELDYVGVTEGEEVKKGNVLARLDTTILYQTYLSAEADLRRYDASKDKTYNDVQGHTKDESFAQIETRTIAETNRDKAYRAYVSAQQNLANATIRAPFDGIISSVTHPFTGVNTSLTESQIEIVNPKTILFEVSADQSEVNQISREQKVIIVLDSISSEEYEGQVEFIGLTPKVGEVGAVYEVKVRFLDANLDANKLRIGMTGDAKFVLSQKENVLFVPSTFVNSDTKGNYLNLEKANNKIYVETGLEGEEKTEIKSGVKEGDVIYD